jgi:hypothetical protein
MSMAVMAPAPALDRRFIGVASAIQRLAVLSFDGRS